ncbi:Janus/Ocnus family protein [Oesophagostomum dentatum]|uniref:Janus/Ocnus family protein n=1 Tax=Oesophagostomum dentatum TaxID=61180 RepID=A0A0B1SLW1_OESDE|nr:Janus/Ocnus family protein [Oesophagostomum dentatum]
MPLADVPDVDIDPSGTFKYILIKCTDNSTKEEKHIVRGYYKCHFHADVLKVAREAVGSAFKLKCVGGGRIKHDNAAKDILVYGYSQV